MYAMAFAVVLLAAPATFAGEGDMGMKGKEETMGMGSMMMRCPMMMTGMCGMMKDMAGMMEKCAAAQKNPEMAAAQKLMEKSGQMMNQCPMMSGGETIKEEGMAKEGGTKSGCH